MIDAIQIDLDDSLANEVQDENEEGARTICEPTHDDQHSDSGEEMQSFDFEQMYERARQAASMDKEAERANKGDLKTEATSSSLEVSASSSSRDTSTADTGHTQR